MSNYSATFAKHATLTAGLVDAVTLQNCYTVEVTNRGSAEVFFTVGSATPAVAGDDSYIVLPATSRQVSVAGGYVTGTTRASTVVKLVSSAATAYSVTTL